MKRSKKQAAATRKAIIDSALAVFGRRGYSAAGLEEIAREAGVTRGAVYWHFKNKLDLYTTLIDQSYERVEAAERLILASDASPLAKIRLILTAYLRHLATDPWFKAIERVSVFNLGKTAELNDLTEQSNAYIRQRRAKLSSLLSSGVEAGEIRDDLSPEVMAAAAVSYLYGIDMSWLSDEGLFSLEADLEGLADVFIDGVRAARHSAEGGDDGESPTPR